MFDDRQLRSRFRISVAASAVALPLAGPALGAAEPPCVPQWDQSPGQGGPTPHSTVLSLAGFNDGSGPALYAGGTFLSAGGQSAHRIAKWDGEQWSGVGGGMSGTLAYVHALVVFDDGAGEALYAGGRFTTAGGAEVNYIARWDGQQWSDVGGGMDNHVRALAVYDDGSGPALYAGGFFTTAGGVEAKGIARWDGEQWSDVGGGVNTNVRALGVYDDGTGEALYAGGPFSVAGGVEANRIAKWDGEQWSALGDGLDNWVMSMAVYDDRSGPALYVGGLFDFAGDVEVNRIARWDGQQWSDVGGGIDAGTPFGEKRVAAMTVYDDGGGDGPALYAAGAFSVIGGVAANHIARWNGEQWCPLREGLMSVAAEALEVYEMGGGPVLAGGPVLFVGGGFSQAGGTTAHTVAAWSCSAVENPGDLTGDGTVGVADLLLLIDAWGACVAGCPGCPSDLNYNGTVGVADLLILISNWG